MRRYRVLLPLTVHTTAGAYSQGEEFDAGEVGDGFDEAANLASGLLEVVPCEYRVVGESTVFGTPPGETFQAGLSLAQEATLLGSHIERVEPKPKPTRRKASDKE